MVLWLLAYIIIGQVAVPMVLSLLGLDRDELSIRGHAILHLCLDLSQLGVTLFILWQCLKKYDPRKRGFFPVRCRTGGIREPEALYSTAELAALFPQHNS